MFLCAGNICRSPTAEVITRNLLTTAGATHVEVWSTGTAADVGYPMDPGSLAQMTAHGLDGTKHVARQVAQQDIDDADMIVALDRLEFLRLRPRVAMSLWPRLRTLTMFDSPAAFGDVPNPWMQSEDVYAAVYEQIERACRTLTDRLLATVPA